MGTPYEADVLAWANEQAALLRSGQLSLIDIEHIAEEIEDVGKSEKRELASRLAVLLAHLLKWQRQPERQGASWRRTIKEQRNAIARHLKRIPSLKATLGDPEWIADVWSDAVVKMIDETGVEELPEACPWSFEQVLSHDFFPD
jgi:hypothetical protein